MWKCPDLPWLRARVAKGYEYLPDPFRIVKLKDGPPDGMRAKVDANLKAGASMSFIYHHGTGYVTADYERDEIGRWIFVGWNDGNGKPRPEIGLQN